MKNLEKEFGSHVFNDRVMKERLTPETYKKLQSTIKSGTTLPNEIAKEVAEAMKEWAIENGATHFTHWFQPLSGATAEKHESFVNSAGGGTITLDFSPSNLVKGEADASSFPSGGLRDTFEARGYTAWDPTSYAFVRDKVLYIPTIFCSYSGETLDHKTPLLRSMEALSHQAVRVLKALGKKDIDHVKATVGAEQEYFLVDKKYYDRREDLLFTGRTLIGAMTPKGQEMDDHYYGSIKTRVSDFMNDLNVALWELGIQAKTEHNEVAPAQHELANNFLTVNVSTDQNNLTMDIMKKIAKKHGLECLLHEKPFAGINGSGKHNNWSLKTDDGLNLLNPGETPSENAQFLVFLTAVIEAVDEYQDLIRISIASAGNDHRLGASEAPPAVISIFVGDELYEVLDSIEKGAKHKDKGRAPFIVNVHSIPDFSKDNTDRNRTSPFAFTGNKFEFRMPGSSASIATPNTILNTVVAEVLKKYADILEKSEDPSKAVHDLIRDSIHAHKRIIFNGNGYDEAWLEEAKKRGLSNYASTPEALAHYLDSKNVKVLVENGVLTSAECHSRYEIYLEKYSKSIRIEGLTLSDMIGKDILPAIASSIRDLKVSSSYDKQMFLEDRYALETLKKLIFLSNQILAGWKQLNEKLSKKKEEGDLATAYYYRDEVLPIMASLRESIDSAERLMPREKWPYPSYRELLFGVD